MLVKDFTTQINQIALAGVGIVKKKDTKRKLLIWKPELFELKCMEKKIYEEWKKAESGEKVQLKKEYRRIANVRRRKLNKYIKEWEQKVIQDIEKLRSKDAKEYWNRLKKNQSKRGRKKKCNSQESEK